ncbi:MAG: phosphoribosylglycinamide formyltransferase [Gammaproteobacteria bacterium]
MMKDDRRIPIVVLISGNGSNLQAIIDAIQNGEVSAEIKAVISNRPDAYGLIRAKEAGIPTKVIYHKAFDHRNDFDTALQHCIDSYNPELVVLAGFMRILGSEFTGHYKGKMLNIHPSLLPAFTGLNTHQRVLDARATEHGVSIHFVTDELDGGPVIAQARIAVHDGDKAEDLANRVLKQEHRIYPLIINWFSEGRIKLEGKHVLLDENPILRPIDCTHT